MKNSKHIKNLSIGWVVKAIVNDYYLTPGYNVVRKIVYVDYNDVGRDFFNDYKDMPIMYPIVDFSDSSKYDNLDNGEYVILPYSSINTYLESFNIIGKINLIKKKMVHNLIFENGCEVNKPLFIKKDIDLTQYTHEIEQLQKYKSFVRINKPSESENQYLEALTTKEIQYKKTI